MASTDYSNIGYWLAIATGIVTGFGTVYGLWREWQMFRQNQVTRLVNAANIAVRRTEASVVRPILSERMADTIVSFVSSHPDCDPIRFRTLLFRDLYRSMKLNADEKEIAKRTACNHLISLLQGMPTPPLRVKKDSQIKKNLPVIEEQVETAYGLRLRPSLDLMQQLASFSGATLHTPS